MADNERHTLDELEAEELEEIAAKEKKESGFKKLIKKPLKWLHSLGKK